MVKKCLIWSLPFSSKRCWNQTKFICFSNLIPHESGSFEYTQKLWHEKWKCFLIALPPIFFSALHMGVGQFGNIWCTWTISFFFLTNAACLPMHCFLFPVSALNRLCSWFGVWGGIIFHWIFRQLSSNFCSILNRPAGISVGWKLWSCSFGFV